ncbi:MAG: phosphoribosylanthranilate isomerase [Sphingomonadaceae bacterium]
MSVRVKICGITTPDALDAALAAGAHAVGFVFFPPSPRALTPATARALAARAPGVRKVGVFVDPDDALLAAAIEGGGLDTVQLQGDEPPERVAEIRQRYGVKVWRAKGVRTAAGLRDLERRFSMADALLLDAQAPDGAPLPGGNGLRFDWRILTDVRSQMPWILAGGLNADNVAEAIRLTGADFVDVSSGVESSPGVKSLAKIAAFTQAAHRA